MADGNGRLTDAMLDWTSDVFGVDTRGYGAAGVADASGSESGDDGTLNGPGPSNLTAQATAIAPQQAQMVSGKLVFRSTHGAAVINSTGSDVNYRIDATLVDSAGNNLSGNWSAVASGSGSQSNAAGPFNLDLPASNYNPGDRVKFTCTTKISGGVSADAKDTNTLTIGTQGLDSPPTPGADSAGSADTADTGIQPPVAAATDDAQTAPTDDNPAPAPPPSDSADDPAQSPASPPDGEPQFINVTIVTAYSMAVRYWIQDCAVDYNHDVAPGAGKVLIDGETHGPGESIQLTCLNNAMGAQVGYTRESAAYPPGGGLMPWTKVFISDGGTATMVL